MNELYLEKLALGELTEKEKKRLDARMSESEQKTAVSRIEAENEAVLSALPPLRASAAPRISENSPRKRGGAETRKGKGWLAAPLLAMAAALALYVFVRPATSPDDDIILKGSVPRLHVYRKSSETVERLDQDAPVRAGDLLQLRYTAGGATHGVILSLDGAGHVTLHFPESPTSSTALTAGRETAVPFAFELDAAPRFERFFFITGAAALPVYELVSRAEALAAAPDADTAPLTLPDGLTQSTHVLRRTP